jgi:hypothetical protein
MSRKLYYLNLQAIASASNLTKIARCRVQYRVERVGEVVASSIVEFEESPGFPKTKLAG